MTSALDADIWIMIHQVGLTRVFAASVCTQGITKLVNALCLDWNKTECLKMLIRVFAVITSMLDGIYTCTMWPK